MELSTFTFIVTGDCNFNCSYCYQTKDKKYMDASTAKSAIDYFFPRLTPDCFVNFYGGEPLLAFKQITDITEYIHLKNSKQKKNITFTISTNGSLVDKEVLLFLNRNKFSVLLSFDGLSQEISRKKGSFSQVASVMEKLRECGDIGLATNSTFTSETVGHLSASIPFIWESGVQNVILSFSLKPAWTDTALSLLADELLLLREYSVSYYRKSGAVPLSCFRKDKNGGISACHAGKNRMALSPDGKLWGCFQFYDFFRNRQNPEEAGKYCFGPIEAFVQSAEKVYPDILAHYSRFRMDNFFTPECFCGRCKELEDCFVCPVDTAVGDSIIGKIPGYLCEIKKIIREEKRRFIKDVEAPT